MFKMTICTRHLVSHSLGLCSADDVTIDCWWRHNDQTIVTQAREKWHLTRYISILFTGTCKVSRVRSHNNVSLMYWFTCNSQCVPYFVGQQHILWNIMNAPNEYRKKYVCCNKYSIFWHRLPNTDINYYVHPSNMKHVTDLSIRVLLLQLDINCIG